MVGFSRDAMHDAYSMTPASIPHVSPAAGISIPRGRGRFSRGKAAPKSPRRGGTPAGDSGITPRAVHRVYNVLRLLSFSAGLMGRQTMRNTRREGFTPDALFLVSLCMATCVSRSAELHRKRLFAKARFTQATSLKAQ